MKRRKIRTNISSDSPDDDSLVAVWTEAVELAARMADVSRVVLWGAIIGGSYFFWDGNSKIAVVFFVIGLLAMMNWLKHTIDESNANYTLHNLEMMIQREKNLRYPPSCGAAG